MRLQAPHGAQKDRNTSTGSLKAEEKRIALNRLVIAIVSPYPPPKVKHVYGSGVAPYVRNLAEALRDTDPKLEIHVVADRREDLPRLYVDNNIIIHRVYTRNPLYVFQVFKELRRINPDVTHIQHEYFLYGGLITAVLFPLLVALSKLVSKKVIVTIHGVIPLKLLEDQEFRMENGIHGPASILKLGLLLVTKLIVLFSNKVVVHEQFLKEYLVNDYKEKPDKIIVIPHGVEDLKPLPKDEAKKRLGLEDRIVLLYFGYLTGYKGIKELLDAYKEIAMKIPNTVLIIAGGPHPRLAREKWYRDWIRNIVKKALDIQYEIKNNGKILLTGYVPEDNVPLYFSAADIVVLPYKARIAASGPEALAVAFKKPFVIAESFITSKGLKVSKIQLSYLINSIISFVYNLQLYENRMTYINSIRKWYNIAKVHLKVFFFDN